MDEVLLITVEYVGQAGEDLLLLASLPADKYRSGCVDRVKIIKPDGRDIEKSGEFSIPLTTPSSFEWHSLIPNTWRDEVSVPPQV